MEKQIAGFVPTQVAHELALFLMQKSLQAARQGDLRASESFAHGARIYFDLSKARSDGQRPTTPQLAVKKEL